jgi:hypothetical protein
MSRNLNYFFFTIFDLKLQINRREYGERIKGKTRTESGIRMAFDVIVNFEVKPHKKGCILCTDNKSY